jgi:hypothetical protein
LGDDSLYVLGEILEAWTGSGMKDEEMEMAATAVAWDDGNGGGGGADVSARA